MIRKITKVFLMVCAIVLVIGKIYLILLSQNSIEKYDEIPQKNVCVALTYHRIRNVTVWDKVLEKTIQPDELIHYSVYTNEFEKQINQLQDEGAYFATLDEVEQFRKLGSFPDKCVWISFDDADETIYKNAFPILKEKHIPFTVFVIAGQMGNSDFSNLPMATWDELREMKDSGIVSFGSHTYNMHNLEDNKAKFLNSGSYNEFYQDIKKSKDVIKSELGVDVTSIAYPFGQASDDIADITAKAGFSDGFILAPHPITSTDDAYLQNRYMIDGENFYKIVLPWLKSCNNS